MPDLDTSLGGVPAEFPTTLWTAVLGAQNAGRPDLAEPHLDQLMRAYWKPVYACIRSTWRATNEEAKDHTQEFFLSFLSQGSIASVDPAKGSFRAYLRGCVRNFMVNRKRYEGRAKRSPGAKLLSLDAPDLELDRLGSEAVQATPEETFDRAWVICLVRDAMAAVERDLVAADRKREWEVYRAFELDGDGSLRTYADLAARFGAAEREVKTALQNVKQKISREIQESIGRYCSSTAERDREFSDLFGKA